MPDNGRVESHFPTNSGLEHLLREMEPELRPGSFVFVDGAAPAARDLDRADILASISEPEGLSVLLRRELADRLGLEYDFIASWIVLKVHSPLDAVGLTAAVSGRLASLGISCNAIAGLRHDHLLVPAERADMAMEALVSLSKG